jgi:flagellar M-ring protein FliF
VRRIITPEPRALPAPPPGGASIAGAAPAMPSVGERVEAALASESQTAKMIDIAQIQGQVHAQSVQKVGELADKNPRETVSIIRQWLNEGATA